MCNTRRAISERDFEAGADNRMTHRQDSTCRNQAIDAGHPSGQLVRLVVAPYAHVMSPEGVRATACCLLSSRLSGCGPPAPVRAVAGACRIRHSSFTDHGPHPGVSCLSRSCSAASWCHITSQFECGDFSKGVTRNGTAALPNTRRTISSSRLSRASSATAEILKGRSHDGGLVLAESRWCIHSLIVERLRGWNRSKYASQYSAQMTSV